MPWVDLPPFRPSQRGRLIAQDGQWPRCRIEEDPDDLESLPQVLVQQEEGLPWQSYTLAALTADAFWYMVCPPTPTRPQVSPYGAFGPPNVVVDPRPPGAILSQLVADELVEGNLLGSYTVAGSQVLHDDVEWAVGAYLDALGRTPEVVTVNEIRFRVHWGEVYGQREITTAIIEAIERMRADAVG